MTTEPKMTIEPRAKKAKTVRSLEARVAAKASSAAPNGAVLESIGFQGVMMDSMDYEVKTRSGPGKFCAASTWARVVLEGATDAEKDLFAKWAVVSGQCSEARLVDFLAYGCIGAMVWHRRVSNEHIREFGERIWEDKIELLGYSVPACRYAKEMFEREHEALVEEANSIDAAHEPGFASPETCEVYRTRDAVGNCHSFIRCRNAVCWKVGQGPNAKIFGRVLGARLTERVTEGSESGSSFDDFDTTSSSGDTREEACHFTGLPNHRLDKKKMMFVEIWTETWGRIEGARMYIENECHEEVGEYIGGLLSTVPGAPVLVNTATSANKADREQEVTEALTRAAEAAPEKSITHEICLKDVPEDLRKETENAQWLADQVLKSGGILNLGCEPYNRMDINGMCGRVGKGPALNLVHLARQERVASNTKRMSGGEKRKRPEAAFNERKAKPKRTVVRKVVMKTDEGVLVQFRALAGSVYEEEMDGARKQVSWMEFDNRTLITEYANGVRRAYTFDSVPKPLVAWVLSLGELCRSHAKNIRFKMPWRQTRSLYLLQNGSLSLRMHWDFDEPVPAAPAPAIAPMRVPAPVPMMPVPVPMP